MPFYKKYFDADFKVLFSLLSILLDEEGHIKITGQYI